MPPSVVIAQSLGDVFGPAAALGLVFVLPLVLMIAAIVATFWGYWKVFEKAGFQGWEALLPYHNLWVHLRIIGRPEWWSLAPLVPAAAYLVFLPLIAIPILGLLFGFVAVLANFAFLIAMIVLYCVAMLGLAQSFGQTTGFGVGLILLPFVFLPLLGFGEARYLGPTGPNPPAPHPLPTPQAVPAHGQQWGQPQQAWGQPAAGWGQQPAAGWDQQAAPGWGQQAAPGWGQQPQQPQQPADAGGWGQQAQQPQQPAAPSGWGQQPDAAGGWNAPAPADPASGWNQPSQPDAGGWNQPGSGGQPGGQGDAGPEDGGGETPRTPGS